jgi:group I intron endonuclease
MDKICGIYKITSPSGRIYIGQSKNIINRFSQYKKWNIKKQVKLYNSFTKYGVDNHIFEIIEQCFSDLLNKRERYWQEYYNAIEDGLNCMYTKTEDEPSKYGKDSFRRRSASLKGVKKSKAPWNKGKTNIYSKETLEKMSTAKKGKISKLRGVKKPHMKGKNNPFYGVKRPEFAEQQKGIKNHRFGKVAINAKKVINIITNHEFNSVKEASVFYNMSYTTLQQKVNGTRKNNTNLKFKENDNK